jgi:hypothetical protein
MARRSHNDQQLILDAALAEYHAMYSLAEYRLVALDRRIPLIGGLLTAFLGSVPVLHETSQFLVLIVIPVSLVWLMRTTINHARSFEDALRRIEQLEHAINARVGVDAMGFQGTHPSKGSTVGGRTGTESVLAVGIASGLLLFVSGIMITQATALSLPEISVCFVIDAAVIVLIARALMGWRTYRYRQNDPFLPVCGD